MLTKVLLLTFAVGTVLGFSILAAIPDGSVHYVGAAFFIAAHIVLQIIFFYIISHIVAQQMHGIQPMYEIQQIHTVARSKKENAKPWTAWNRIEVFILVAAVIGSILFVSLLVADPSASAAAEYVVFVCFLFLNWLVSMVMTYVGLHFEPCTLETLHSTSSSSPEYDGKVFWRWRSTNTSESYDDPIKSNPIVKEEDIRLYLTSSLLHHKISRFPMPRIDHAVHVSHSH
jgi:hypothetical protein